MGIAELVHQKTARITKEREHLSCKDKLRELSIYLAEENLGGDPVNTVNIWGEEGNRDDRVKLFSVVSSERMTGNSHNLKYRKFHLSI